MTTIEREIAELLALPPSKIRPAIVAYIERKVAVERAEIKRLRDALTKHGIVSVSR